MVYTGVLAWEKKMTEDKLREEIKNTLVDYRIKCDMALSEKNEEYMTQEEYYDAIIRQGDLSCETILKNMRSHTNSVLARAIRDSDIIHTEVKKEITKTVKQEMKNKKYQTLLKNAVNKPKITVKVEVEA